MTASRPAGAPAVIRIHVLRGALSGDVRAFSQDIIRIGRQPDADLQFSAEADLEVSSNHATLFRQGERWLVRDAGSRNGTFLNGRPVTHEEEVQDGDRLAFSTGGPLVEVRFGEASEAPSRTAVLRVRYARQTRRLTWTAVAFGIVLVSLAASLIHLGTAGQRERAAWTRERESLLARMDSLLAESDRAVASLRGELDGLAQALGQSQTEVRQARTALTALAPDDGGEAAEQLRRQLRLATEALTRQQLAASLDFRAIEQANRNAVALIYVESDNGAIATGTAFAVRPDGTLLTASHVVSGPDRTRQVLRVAVQFSDSEQFFPARIVAIASDADLAVLKVDYLLGDVPVVAGINARADTISAGAPVAIIGFPLGGATVATGARPHGVARPLVTAAIITGGTRGTSSTARELELQGYGAAGASGSPIFDADGRVVAILIGGRNTDNHALLVAVPATAAELLLSQLR